MSVIRDTWVLLKTMPKALPDLAADRMEQIVLGFHWPVYIGPGEPRVCLRCRCDAPCAEFIRVTEARANRLIAGGMRWK